ncbi:MAG TPA: hypothetical protein VL728_05645 [Cyclobacteriaceae bacterium]|jgi:hypothetical protein|nr:hypothetical protein [Cyclobacteriaceae bacterium]
MKRFVSGLCCLVCFSCASGQGSNGKNIVDDIFAASIDVGQVDSRLNEASGLVASFQNPNCFWSVNDSDNPAEVFLIDDKAKTKVICKLPGVKNRDWEDIAIGNGPQRGKKYLYVAEIGDNNAIFDFKYIYRFEEPSLKNGANQVVTHIEKLVVKMPDGRRDTETLMIDQSTNDLYIISKREAQVRVYQQKYPYPDTLKPVKVLDLPFNWVTAGSISLKGDEVLIKNYSSIFYWKRTQEKSLVELLSKAPVEIPYNIEPQGEAICFANDGLGFYTVSETRDGSPMAQLKFYKRLK